MNSQSSFLHFLSAGMTGKHYSGTFRECQWPATLEGGVVPSLGLAELPRGREKKRGRENEGGSEGCSHTDRLTPGCEPTSAPQRKTGKPRHCKTINETQWWPHTSASCCRRLLDLPRGFRHSGQTVQEQARAFSTTVGDIQHPSSDPRLSISLS